MLDYITIKSNRWYNIIITRRWACVLRHAWRIIFDHDHSKGGGCRSKKIDFHKLCGTSCILPLILTFLTIYIYLSTYNVLYNNIQHNIVFYIIYTKPRRVSRRRPGANNIVQWTCHNVWLFYTVAVFPFVRIYIYIIIYYIHKNNIIEVTVSEAAVEVGRRRVYIL